MWVTVLVNAFSSTQDYLIWILTGQGRPSYQILTTGRGLPADANVTYDSPSYWELAIPPNAPTPFPPTAVSIYDHKSYVDGWYIGIKYFTWVTLAELLAYPWDNRWTYPIDVDAGQTPLYNAGEACSAFYQTFIPFLQNTIATKYSVTPDNIRVLFGVAT